MNCDEARADYLERGDASLGALDHFTGCADCRAMRDELDAIRAELGNDWMWEEPGDDLAASVVAAVAAAAGTTVTTTPGAAVHTPAAPTTTPTEPAPAGGGEGDGDRHDDGSDIDRLPVGAPRTADGGAALAPVVSLDARRARRSRIVAVAASVVAAAAVVVAVVAVSTRSTRGATTVDARGTELAAGVLGTASVRPTDSGVHIHLNAPGLPRRDNGAFYEAWLKGPNGLVPIGTFHTADDVDLWSGVPVSEYPTLTVTEETADGNQASSGRVVLTARVG